MLLLLVFLSCEEENPEVSFRVKMEGFEMKSDPDFPQPGHTAFKHRYSAGLISFSRDQQNHSFYVKEGEIEDYLFNLPVGEYVMNADIPGASLYGQASGSFRIEPLTVSITELTDTITIRSEANCSLILVRDELGQLDEGPFIIERHSYSSGSFKSYPMVNDSASGMYYAYFTPDPDTEDPSAFLWFYGGRPGLEDGGMATTRFEPGYQYFISILE